VCACLLALQSAVAAHAAPPAPSDAEYHKLCGDQAATFARSSLAGAADPARRPSDCAFFPRRNALTNGIRVFLRIDDGDQTLWSTGDHPYGTFAAGGDRARAKWGYQSGRLPSVVDARRGAFTCTVIPSRGTKVHALPGNGPRPRALCAAALTALRRRLRRVLLTPAGRGCGGRGRGWRRCDRVLHERAVRVHQVPLLLESWPSSGRQPCRGEEVERPPAYVTWRIRSSP